MPRSKRALECGSLLPPFFARACPRARMRDDKFIHQDRVIAVPGLEGGSKLPHSCARERILSEGCESPPGKPSPACSRP